MHISKHYHLQYLTTTNLHNNNNNNNNKIKMFTKSILLPFLLIIIFVSASQASRQLWDGGFSEMFGSKSGFHGFSGFSGTSGGAGGGFAHGDMTTQTCPAQGPCNGKKLTCPEECYKSTNVNKDGYKSTSRSGGCSFDCTTKCAASCST